VACHHEIVNILVLLHLILIYNYKVAEDEVGGHVARMGEKRNVYRLLVGKPEGKRPLRRL
jgi:hypothetical protein